MGRVAGSYNEIICINGTSSRHCTVHSSVAELQVLKKCLEMYCPANIEKGLSQISDDHFQVVTAEVGMGKVSDLFRRARFNIGLQNELFFLRNTFCSGGEFTV